MEMLCIIPLYYIIKIKLYFLLGKFSKMVNNIVYLNRFVASCVTFLRKWDFDGLDVNWEHPAGRGNSPAGDKQKFTQLIRKLLNAFIKDSNENKPRLLLTAAVSAGIKTIESGYEVKILGNLLDWINLMTYDLHGHWDDVTGHHTAMASDGGR